MMRRLLTFLGLGLILAVAVAGCALIRPDIAHETLVARYGGTQSQFVTLPSGARAHYRDQGNPSGPLLLLLHGSNSNLFTWENWVGELGQDFRIVTLDLPGHGMTGAHPQADYSADAMAAFVAEFSAAKSFPSFICGGNSMGGAVALRFALARPEEVSALVLVDPAGVDVPGENQEPPFVFRLARMPVLNNLLLYVTPRGLIASGLKAAYGNPDLVTEAWVTLNWEMILHEGNRRATLKRMGEFGRAPLNDRLGEVRAPTLILWGEADRITPIAAAPIFAAGIAGAELVTFSGIGHVPHEEAPAESAAALRAFLGARAAAAPPALPDAAAP